MKIIHTPLPEGQYFKAEFLKQNIVLHHTVSSTAKSALTWWSMTADRVGTAYVVDKDGTIYQAFDPKYWAYHLGLKTSRNTELNRRSIGIELVNEGPLLKMSDGTYRWNFAPGKSGIRYQGEALPYSWRGYEHWADYTPEQYAALNALLPMLVDRFKLKPTLYTGMDYNPAAPDKATIYSHRNVRTDKSDLSPAFDFTRITCFNQSI